MSKVAVLIPTYKPQAYLEKCLFSLDKQTLNKNKFCVYIALNGLREPYETYILNLLQDIEFNYKYIYVEEVGVSKARNILIEQSNEEFVCFVDDDDLVSKNYLENLLAKTTEEFMGISNIYNFEKDVRNLKENVVGKSFFYLHKIEKSKYKARKYLSAPWGNMLSRKMVQNIRFDEKVFKGEDSLFMAAISKNILGLQKTSEDTCYLVYERFGSATRRKVKASKELKNLFYLVYQYCKFLFKKDYNKLFIMIRVVATLVRILRMGKTVCFWRKDVANDVGFF